MKPFPKPAALAETPPDPIEAVSLTSYELAFGVATVLGAELAKRDAREAAMLARIAVLEAAATAPADLDGMPRPGGYWKTIKQVAIDEDVTEGAVRYWIKQNKITTMKYGPRACHYLVDARSVRS